MRRKEQPTKRPGWEMVGTEQSDAVGSEGIPVWVSSTTRLKVPGGWLYREAVIMHEQTCSIALCFVRER